MQGKKKWQILLKTWMNIYHSIFNYSGIAVQFLEVMLYFRRKSLVDGRPMDGIPSVKMMHTGPDYTSKSHTIRWTEVYMLPKNAENNGVADYSDPPDPSRISSHIAKAISLALLPHLNQLKNQELSPLSVRVCLDPENVSCIF